MHDIVVPRTLSAEARDEHDISANLPASTLYVATVKRSSLFACLRAIWRDSMVPAAPVPPFPPPLLPEAPIAFKEQQYHVYCVSLQ